MKRSVHCTELDIDVKRILGMSLGEEGVKMGTGISSLG
jgi:hypothetical protein